MQEVEVQESEVPLEFQVFALAMRQPGAINQFAEELPSNMVGAIHGDTGINEFYNSFLHFYEKTGLETIDPIAWKAWLETETDIYESLGGPAAVNFFVDTCVNLELSTTDSVIKVLRYRANKRKQLNDIQTLQAIVSKKGHKTEGDLDQISKLTEQIRALENDLQYDPLASVSTALDISGRAEQLMEVPDFLPTPFKDYNKALGYTEDGGYFRGAVHAIVAPSGKGKSTFAKCLCNYWADTGYTVLFVNFEEAQAHWERILMSQIIQENVYAKAGLWTKQEQSDRIETFREKLDEWGERFMVRHDPDTSFFEDLELWLRDIIGHNANIPDVVVIDTIQSLFIKGGGNVRWAEYEKMMVRFEKLAKEMDAVFILTAQQNLNAQKEKREVIEQQDAGGSISIVQKCSVVTFITPMKLAGDTDNDDIMQLQIPKNRITGTTYVNNPPLVRYVDESKSYEDYETIEDDVNYEAVNMAATDIFGLGDFNG